MIARIMRTLRRVPCLVVFGLVVAAWPAPVPAQTPSPAEIADYQAKLARYEQARQAYNAQASVYWDAIADKRRTRNAKRREHVAITIDDYVLTHPPQYAGPPRPIDPLGRPTPPDRPEIPVVADFLKAASEQFGVVLDRPQNAADF